jgi:hypothetical protein
MVIKCKKVKMLPSSKAFAKTPFVKCLSAALTRYKTFFRHH